MILIFDFWFDRHEKYSEEKTAATNVFLHYKNSCSQMLKAEDSNLRCLNLHCLDNFLCTVHLGHSLTGTGIKLSIRSCG